ncbi:MAG: UDP-N-acetylglucosamine--N-acetylmuramyl-(pentapeptide) pyrophosphoryl-undecaprenol N-acetylglucosamine transferase [Candidatus Taylorbacteria bacterium CG11_big_fil_rev_8_21_14_0_20_46_11]|uniref:UDP-N-acetylglucosamine--N-acetylmuramyl-(pentapeptide) pyrophosphoryl-undecaprenol N-acetylglucosamine transferase n=1 Tax=Candidatus Taylorbacteria bacterium CG11_big_fil_rev_8_21_14_0_20_46_11 TaxID=1975025 RepID=A0A2H0KA73_9BACT|nr:MAG: UDP-N-acetylglucosamine--N-acetylmuramyl-(pentapeptide) pyrophosphoryl-undecaprenol N-acetylglucosamine transferase [Candidatus Taylorbacteria bacterium CG11_big_fil_rev_8_21_14_0_20_46_11]
MKILFTGGGSGGHFYPIIAIAEEIRHIADRERLIAPSLYFMAPDPYDKGLLFNNDITYIHVPAGKLRRYLSLANVFDFFKTVWGILVALVTIFRIYPDVIVGKGGFGSFPVLIAAKLWSIPVIIHESDSVPGRVNQWAGKFAKRVAVSFAEAASFFPADKVAYVGNPVRHELLKTASVFPKDFTPEPGRKTILVIGGSLGSVTINEAIFKILPDLLTKYNIIHQTGKQNIAELIARASVTLQNHPHKDAYRPVGYIQANELSSIGQLVDLIISRSGSTIFEIALWKKPSILIPIADSNGDHQRENAYNYAQSGASSIIEEYNLTSTILRNEIEKLLGNDTKLAEMSERAGKFAKQDSAGVIAREIITMALKHEK